MMTFRDLKLSLENMTDAELDSQVYSMNEEGCGCGVKRISRHEEAIPSMPDNGFFKTIDNSDFPAVFLYTGRDTK